MQKKILTQKIQPKNDLKYEPARVDEFCRQWKVSELAFFGSVLREEFRDDSDIDILISFDPDASWSLFDLVTMQDQLEDIFSREVDLVEKDGLINPFRRRSILEEMVIIYAAP
jgi:uncharacterized protein